MKSTTELRKIARSKHAAVTKIADGCSMTVVTESAATIHHDDMITSALTRSFNYDAHYDLLAVPSLRELLKSNDHIQILANDVMTAVSLHHVESLLIASMSTGCAAQIRRRITQACPAIRNMHIRETTLERPRNLELHEPLVLTCMDWRLHGANGFRSMMQGAFAVERFALMSTAGAGKELGHLGARTKMVLSQLSRFANAGVTRVIVLSHTDCGKYGGNAAFADDHAQCVGLTSDLGNATKLLREKFPKIRFETGIIRCHGHDVTGVEPTTHHH